MITITTYSEYPSDQDRPVKVIEMSPDSKEQPNTARIPPRREGYGLLGRLMGEAPEAAIFRSFAAISAEDLLYRQAELISLEKDWRETQERLRESSNEATQDCIYNWDEIQHSENLTAVLKIRETVDNYRKYFFALHAYAHSYLEFDFAHRALLTIDMASIFVKTMHSFAIVK
ncbi:hypothetical protein V8F33_005047 [Rhypophila sp. PSN 637]